MATTAVSTVAVTAKLLWDTENRNALHDSGVNGSIELQQYFTPPPHRTNRITHWCIFLFPPEFFSVTADASTLASAAAPTRTASFTVREKAQSSLQADRRQQDPTHFDSLPDFSPCRWTAVCRTSQRRRSSMVGICNCPFPRTPCRGG